MTISKSARPLNTRFPSVQKKCSATGPKKRVAASAAQSSIGLKFLYTGRPWSPVSETYYYRARWYEPTSGRFISRDPISYLAGNGLVMP